MDENKNIPVNDMMKELEKEQDTLSQVAVIARIVNDVSAQHEKYFKRMWMVLVASIIANFLIVGAKEYAKLATHYKTEQPTLAKAYYDMANDELRYADMLHTEAVKLIEKQRAIEPPPPVMLELWDYEHKEYIEEYAIAKNMIALYSNPR